MKRIVLALRELKQVLHNITFCEVVLDSLLVFLIGLLVCMIFALPWGLSFIPFAMFAARHTTKKFSRIKLRHIEGKVPELKYQLTTAADNLYKENELVSGLHDDVLRLMPLIRISDFMPFKKLWREIILMAMLSFSIILVTSFNLQMLDYKILVKELRDIKLDSGESIFLETDREKADSAVNEDIWGDESVVKLGDEQLNLQITPSMSEINIDDVQDIPEKGFEPSPFPEDIRASSDASFDEKIPKENKEIVKRYFSKIAKIK